MSFLDKAQEGREPLAPGSYNDLKILKYNGSRDTKTEGNKQHRFGVVSKTREGFCNLYMLINDFWLDDAVMALALGTTSDAINEGAITAADVERAQAKIKSIVDEKIAEANTPDELVAEKTEEFTRKLLNTIKINVGTLLRLQKYAGDTPSLVFDVEKLVGITFRGKVIAKAGSDGKEYLEVDSVYAVPKDYKAPAKDTEFATV